MEEKLINYFKQYEIQSLARAIYAITSWPSNRRYVSSVDLINRCLISVEDQYGFKKIDSYAHLNSLFIDIRSIIKSTLIHSEGFSVDTGQVKFISKHQYKKIFVSNGSEDIYETCFLVNDLVDFDINLKDIWEEILDYENKVLSLIYKNNIDYSQEFSSPSENYFQNIKIEFSNLNNNKLKTFFAPIKSVNKQLYPFFTPIKGLPVFLPLMKEVFTEEIEKRIDEQSKIDEIFKTFTRSLNINFYPTHHPYPNFGNSIKINRNLPNIPNLTLKNIILFWNDQHVKILLPFETDKRTVDILLEEILNESSTILIDTFNGAGILSLPSESDVDVFYLDSRYLSPNHTKSISSTNLFTPTDIMGIINTASSIEEIIDFCNFMNEYNSGSFKLLGMSGLLGLFQTWKDMDRQIIEGSANVKMVIMEPYMAVNRIVDQYSEEFQKYPYLLEVEFPGIHFWNINRESTSDLSLYSKSNSVLAEVLCENSKYIIFQELTSISDDLGIDEYRFYQSFKEIIMNSIHEYKNLILNLLSTKVLDIHIVSDEVLKKSVSFGKYLDSKYFEHVSVFSKQDCQRVLIKPKWNDIFNKNMNSKTKEFENSLIIDLLSLILFIDKESLISHIKKSDSSKRKTLITYVEIQYFINENYTFKTPDDISFKAVRKLISQTINKLKLRPGAYEEQEALNLIKTFRISLQSDLRKKINRLNLNKVHTKLMDEYSALILEIDLQTKRLSSFSNDENLDEIRMKEFREETISQREKSRRYKEIIEYIIEENLVSKRNVSNQPTNRDIDNIIAYSKWIMDFQNISDAINHGAGSWYALEILEDFRVDIIETNKLDKDLELLSYIKYKFPDYAERDIDYDTLMFNRLEDKFYEDTGIKYGSLIITLSFLSRNDFVNEFLENNGTKLYINSLKTSINFLENKILDMDILCEEQFKKTIEFLTVDIDSISNSTGTIPVWEKKKRVHKISAKPLVVTSDDLIYSPAAVHYLKSQWMDGIMNFTLPYNSGLEKTLKLLDEWKTFYEKKIVQDLFNLFSIDNYVAYKDQQLHKLDKVGSHPRNLGDYDLIVFDLKKKEILLFEVKYMRMSFTFKDSIGGDQETYFTGKRAKAIQFENRTKYFEENSDRIMHNLGHSDKFKIKKYFITNKNIRSLFKDYPFEIMSFNEFKLTKM